jgi:hypothetical protein
MLGVKKYVFQGTVLNNLACVHYGHIVTYFGDDAQIVGYHDQGCFVLPFEPLHQFQHLGLGVLP